MESLLFASAPLWAVALQRGPVVPPFALESALSLSASVAGLRVPGQEGSPSAHPAAPPSPPWLVDKSLVGAAMGSPFPCWGPRGVCTIPLILWVPSQLEAETEPGLHLSPSGPAFFCASCRVLSTSLCLTPRPPESGGVPVE